jgi:hypothetical protein
MKKILSTVAVTLCFFTAAAQTDLKKKIVDSTCACLSEIPDIDKKTPEELQMVMGQCMMQKSLTDVMALAQERNIEITDMEGMQKLMAEIGIEMTKADCKALNSLMMKMAQRGGGNRENGPDAKESAVIKGKVQNVEVKDFVYITILADAKATQLVWSDFVTGGNAYAKNLVSLKNKTLQFYYVTKEVYSIKAKAYVAVKMVTAVK